MSEFNESINISPEEEKKIIPENLYSIIACKTIRANSKYSIGVTLHKAKSNCEIKVGIRGGSFEVSRNVVLEPETLERIEFDIPDIKEDEYEFYAEGVSNIEFTETKRLDFDDKKPLILIQTDKATYKPSDEVKFRVLFMDENTRPIELAKTINVDVFDGDHNRVKQWKDIKPGKGVFTSCLQLSEQPVLGTWTLNVYHDGIQMEKKTFEIAKYVLPKFSVVLKSDARDVALADDIVKVSVHSKYTYGKGVKGQALVSIKPIFFMFCGSEQSNECCAEKTIDVDGKGYAEFSLKDDLKLTLDSCKFPPNLAIKAVMEEDLTGNKCESEPISVQVHTERYKIEGMDLCYRFEPNVPVTFKALIKNLDGNPLLNATSSARLLIERPNFTNAFYVASDSAPPNEDAIQKELIELESEVDDKGTVAFEYTFNEDAADCYDVQCVYEDSKAFLITLHKSIPKQDEKEFEYESYADEISLDLLTKDPHYGDTVKIQVNFKEETPFFVYGLVSRCSLIAVDLVRLEENSKSKIIEFETSHELMPEVKVLVRLISKGKLYTKEESVIFRQTLRNTIEIRADAEARPGDETTLQIDTKPDSYVGLLAVDESVLLLSSGNDLMNQLVYDYWNEMCPVYHHWDHFTLTNADHYTIPVLYSSGLVLDSCLESCGGAPCPPQAIQIRKEFPETWIFEDFESSTADGLTLTKKLPDTITSWVITGFSLNPETGFSCTNAPTKIKTFTPFFISTNLPYSIKRGEQVTIPVLVFNYTESELEVIVVMENDDDEFVFVSETNDPEETQEKRTKQVIVPANDGCTVNFAIRPKNIGNITLKLTATCPMGGDAIHKQLKVEPEGITIYKNHDYFLHSADSDEVDITNTVNLIIPDTAVVDSEFIEVTLMGNILGSAITNIDKLVRMPYGCGEQNMVNFVPNILVLWYLESIEELSPAIEAKAKRFLEIGYQRELTYKHDNGSYSAFGKSDASGSTWLTAYVMRSFHQAKKYIDIDPNILEAGLKFLSESQSGDGSFEEKGRLFDSSHMNELGLTAFVLLAFLENTESAEQYSDVIDRGFEFLQQNIGKCGDLYAMAVCMFAMQQRKLESVHELLAKLDVLARMDGGLKWWSKEMPSDQESSIWLPRNNDVEITAYIVMTLLDMNISSLSIIKWLISQRNCHGGFASTQDTVVGLWALIKFAEMCGAGNPDISIELDAGIEGEEKILANVNKENALVVQRFEMPKRSRQITFSCKGRGTSALQVSYQYNVLEKLQKPKFKLSTVMKPVAAQTSRLTFDVLASFTPESTECDISQDAASNMVVLEVSLPSGYVAVPESFEAIKAVENVKRVETKNDNTNVVVYFDQLKASDEKCIPIQAELVHSVSGQKPVPIVIYDYYDTQKRAVDFYGIS